MKTDDFKTDVIFRKEKDGCIVAVFPYNIEGIYMNYAHILYYSHIGQHCCGLYSYALKETKPATKREYSDLKYELESDGYNLNVIKRRNYNKYLKALSEARNIKSYL